MYWILFKVTQKIEVMSFPSYSGIKISAEELEEELYSYEYI